MAGRAGRWKPDGLPAELTSFVGRRRELSELKKLLTSTRLLALTGNGDVGKIRLALRAASEMARNFPDGVWFVSLVFIHDPLLIPQTVFSALGLQDRSARWSLAALAGHLRDKRLLLVLDNCEHLLDGSAGPAGTLLRSCPELRILATSRQALGTAGDVRLRVPRSVCFRRRRRSVQVRSLALTPSPWISTWSSIFSASITSTSTPPSPPFTRGPFPSTITRGLSGGRSNGFERART